MIFNFILFLHIECFLTYTLSQPLSIDIPCEKWSDPLLCVKQPNCIYCSHFHSTLTNTSSGCMEGSFMGSFETGLRRCPLSCTYFRQLSLSSSFVIGACCTWKKNKNEIKMISSMFPDEVHIDNGETSYEGHSTAYGTFYFPTISSPQ